MAKATKSKTATPPTPEFEVSSTKKGLSSPDYDRETFIVRVDLMEKIKDVAYWDRQLLKETIEMALSSFIDGYEKSNGIIKSRPDEVKEREKLRSNSGRKRKE
ncbi:hypothetical protein SAMN05444008_11275 [Cnuella takakiae]|uniref:Uncharacterized protein n=1 Tax=Cnuella takakiae TaxID=1302690 RepID=A0A1M5EJS4_9BACT|nr:hypothetical protein [Cnuella takakiae]OLY91201.1 hypothetical protein BUE76_04275 [Cnuella takakiae]SHF79475.1 hypothetical protein SAMN05444008_11275 [Cnuella takakiae]